MRASRHRRDFLRAVGAGFAALPFFRLVEDSYAQSMGETLPLRFIGLYHPHGVAAELFTMQDGDTETSFELDYPDSPLQPFDDAATYGKSFKDKIVVIEGLDLLSEANAHETAATILTGSRLVSGMPTTSSLDQFLAVDSHLGDETRVTSVALAVGSNELKARETLSFAAGGVPISKIIDPALAFDLFFRQAVVPGDAAARAAAARQQKLGQSLIDFVRGDVGRLRARLGSFEVAKLDQHLDSLRQLEKQLQAVPDASCPVPARPGPFPALERYQGGEPYFDAITDLHIDLLAAAMGCDITRFATLALGDLSYANNPLGLPEDNHGAMAHIYKASPLGMMGLPVGEGDPATWRLLATFNRYCYGKVARLMQRLDEAGILDSTLIYASSDMGNPAAHSTRNVPTVLAGGANGQIRMGRRLKYRTECPLNTACTKDDPDYRTMPNNRLLVSIARAFGLDIDTFGNVRASGVQVGGLDEL